MFWWLLNLHVLSLEGAFIPDPDGYFQRSAVLLYPDAAGGSTSACRKGWGCCHPEKKEYARGSWQAYILKNSELNGQTWGKRLSILEVFFVGHRPSLSGWRISWLLEQWGSWWTTQGLCGPRLRGVARMSSYTPWLKTLR